MFLPVSLPSLSLSLPSNLLLSSSSPVTIIFPGFLVINKQCGQRMDGNFEGTIEKLVLQLTDVVKFRPIHQLDFATSGVLAFL
jgi:23S rRNA-/tRNA-specific pseudouridylate synthase